MAIKRTTPPDDSDRLAENLYNYDRNIIDRPTFDDAYDRYLEDSPEAINNQELREQTFQSLTENYSTINNENLHKKAGGKNLKQDQRKNAKTIVKTRGQYIKQGATKVDLQNYDTIAKRKNAIIFARETKITRKNGKSHIRLRDAKGRFVTRREK